MRHHVVCGTLVALVGWPGGLWPRIVQNHMYSEDHWHVRIYIGNLSFFSLDFLFSFKKRRESNAIQKSIVESSYICFYKLYARLWAPKPLSSYDTSTLHCNMTRDHRPAYILCSLHSADSSHCGCCILKCDNWYGHLASATVIGYLNLFHAQVTLRYCRKMTAKTDPIIFRNPNMLPTKFFFWFDDKCLNLIAFR